jgi:hypothetical protein
MAPFEANLRMAAAIARLLEVTIEMSVDPEYAHASAVGRVNVWAYRIERLVKSIEEETELLMMGSEN